MFLLMRTHPQNEDGFLLIEVILAMMIITIALLGLIGAYSFGVFATGASGTTSSAGLIANNQLELYSSLSYNSIGFDSTTLTNAKANASYTYNTDETALNAIQSGTDVTNSTCGSSTSPQCSPVQTVTAGVDHKTYKIETFIRCVANPSISSRKAKLVTVYVQNASASGSPSNVLKMQTAFDSGAATSTC